MKRTTLTIAFGILVTILCLRLQALRHRDFINLMPTEKPDTVPALREGTRPSVAFILGDDKEDDNPYYSEALKYYTSNPNHKTDFVVKTCRSLTEVKHWLNDQAVRNAQPWGEVHLVSHGNQWSGLSVKVAIDSKRATAQRLMEYLERSDFEPMAPYVLDDLSKIFLHGCGVGNDDELVHAVRLFMSGSQSSPVVYAPKFFEFYTSSGNAGHRYLAESFFVSYRMGERPATFELVNELREKHSDVAIDWTGALTREKPRWIGDTYHYTFEVPVKWTVQSDSLPEVDEQIAWLQAQPEIMDELIRLDIPVDKFKWSFTSGYADQSTGERVRAVNVKGYCTMLCVVRVINATGDIHLASGEKAYDPQYYYRAAQPFLAEN